MRLDWLGSEWLTWRDLLVVVRRSPTTSALARVILGEVVEWSTAEYLLAQIADNTAWLVWAKTDDGAKGRNRPQRLRRPGDPELDSETQYGSEPLSLEAMQEWLGWQMPTAEQTNNATEVTDG